MAVAERSNSSTAQPDPGERGSLVIKDRAMSKIATAAAVNVPGVVRQTGGLTRLTGRDLPRADIAMGADAIAVNLFIAVTWPCSVVDLTGRVRDEVGRSVESLTGYPLTDMNVMIAATCPPEESTPVSTEDADTEQVSQWIPPRVPSAAPAAAISAVVVAFGLLALAFVVSREWFINRGTFESAPWIQNSVEWASRLHWEPWLLPTAIAAVVAGVVLVVTAVKPRAKTHVALGNPAASTVWMRPTDIARLCSGHAASVPGVLRARTTVDRKHAKIHVDTAGGDHDALITAVEAAVQPHLDILQRPVQLTVLARAVLTREMVATPKVES
ncbi:DUF6286 domain-containing protein [Rhodococcus sp. ARC_M6]|uniref:DUF6286 domain-containing protein n=1 Tax=Rhodococcus sp. ARC_M6 TaxID=2928852 RepID=UPI001FB429C6|nr:DUF6286 domain-containing Asp23/Gls24 family envelope stress response protein [Rhodococcus sp. ARC_M6]MCJ0903941.1 Asp23/Gls24 family envelope stress response protein [Rhodococcus sp. ARC_M6]